MIRKSLKCSNSATKFIVSMWELRVLDLGLGFRLQGLGVQGLGCRVLVASALQWYRVLGFGILRVSLRCFMSSKWSMSPSMAPGGVWASASDCSGIC